MEYNVSKVTSLIMMVDSGCETTEDGKKRICNFLLSTQFDNDAVIYANQTKDLFEKGRYSTSSSTYLLFYTLQ